MMLSSITLIVVGSGVLVLSLAYIPVLVVQIFWAAGSTFVIVAGVLGLLARNQYSLGKAHCFRLCLLFLLGLESFILVIVLLFAFVFFEYIEIFILPIVIIAAMVAFLSFSVYVSTRFIELLRNCQVPPPAYEALVAPIQVGYAPLDEGDVYPPPPQPVY